MSTTALCSGSADGFKSKRQQSAGLSVGIELNWVCHGRCCTRGNNTANLAHGHRDGIALHHWRIQRTLSEGNDGKRFE